MVSPTSDSPQCPRCGSTAIALCGQSIQYGPPERPEQPLQAREIRTLAYECNCGMAFTQTVKGDGWRELS